ncbi:PREDICTED: HAUS augmin-like complex subunit 8 [Nipponia nippon]|uniref:HAUS augmin-like complex subunit 8 n=1 Tax=Nipponia nippon TaxID=128390 RepID=UPI0005108940|nr:PREDICTED: HAUS augmin-like complex subunit 8 [Nipponia nippon]
MVTMIKNDLNAVAALISARSPIEEEKEGRKESGRFAAVYLSRWVKRWRRAPPPATGPRSPLPGGRIVKSRYLQYDKKDAKKDTSANSFSTSAGNPSSATKPRSLPQQCKTSAGVVSSSLNQSSFEKGDLQSTLLDEDKASPPDLDLSAINDKTVHKKTPASNSACKGNTGTHQKPEETGNDADDLMKEMESQTLLLTYLRVKAGKNLAELEKKAEKNLLMLCEEKERQQEKLCELKREILLREREQKLDDALDKQMEVLSSLVPVCEQFKEQYKSFADSLDATRHELPMKNIHIEGDMLTYLDELRKQLTITQELLAEVMPSHSEESAKAFSGLKELKEVSQKLDKELQRSFTQVQNLSFEVSKEVSLHNQRICEENHGLDVVKHWYFN